MNILIDNCAAVPSTASVTTIAAVPARPRVGVADPRHDPGDAAGQPRAGAARASGTPYVNVVRNTPLTLVFLFFVFALPATCEIIEMSLLHRSRSSR